MDKIELHGATLPDGWTVSRHSHHADMLLIERPQDDAGFGGYTAVDLKNRIFRDGINGLRAGGPDQYKGRGWVRRLINDACTWLEKTMTKTSK